MPIEFFQLAYTIPAQPAACAAGLRPFKSTKMKACFERAANVGLLFLMDSVAEGTSLVKDLARIWHDGRY